MGLPPQRTRSRCNRTPRLAAAYQPAASSSVYTSHTEPQLSVAAAPIESAQPLNNKVHRSIACTAPARPARQAPAASPWQRPACCGSGARLPDSPRPSSDASWTWQHWCEQPGVGYQGCTVIRLGLHRVVIPTGRTASGRHTYRSDASS